MEKGFCGEGRQRHFHFLQKVGGFAKSGGKKPNARCGYRRPRARRDRFSTDEKNPQNLKILTEPQTIF